MWLPVPGSAGIANKTCTVRLRRILRSAAWRKGVTLVLEDVLTHHELVISDFIAEELVRKLRDKFNFPESEVRELRRFLRRVATAVASTRIWAWPTVTTMGRNPIVLLGVTTLSGQPNVLSRPFEIIKRFNPRQRPPAYDECRYIRSPHAKWQVSVRHGPL